MDEEKQALSDLKARQLADERMPCPRCGRDAMDEKPIRNALSRQADVFVCDSCGQQEAILAMLRRPESLADWACFIQPEAYSQSRS